MKRFFAIDTDLTTCSTRSSDSFTKSTFAEPARSAFLCRKLRLFHNHGKAASPRDCWVGDPCTCQRLRCLQHVLGDAFRLPARWTTVANLQHVWTEDESERQVRARLDALKQIQRLGEHAILIRCSMQRVSFSKILRRLAATGRRKRRIRIHHRETSRLNVIGTSHLRRRFSYKPSRTISQRRDCGNTTKHACKTVAD